MSRTPGGREGDATPLGPGDLFHTPGLRLPNYVRQVAHALMRSGHPKSDAIRLAIGTIRNWAEGKGNVRPQVRAGAAKALAEWEAAKAAARAVPNR